jgi:dUTPase
MPSILYIVPAATCVDTYTAAAAAYNARAYKDRDAGFDVYCEGVAAAASGAPTMRMISQQVAAGYYDTERGLFRAFWMLPRSSISKSGLRLANSVGLIDAGYRGTIKAACDGVAAVEANTRLFQLAAPDLLPWDEVRVVAEIPGGATLRGAGGFGSTGGGASGAGVSAANAAPDAAVYSETAGSNYGYFTA